MKNRLSTLLLSLTLSFAASGADIEFWEVINSVRSPVSLDLSETRKVFQKNTENVHVFSELLPIDLGEKIINAKSAPGKATFDHTTLVIPIFNLRGKFVVKLEEGIRQFAYQRSMGSKILASGCSEHYEKFNVVPAKFPFNIAIKCEKSENQTFVSITVPGGVNWEGTSLFDLAGKGEQSKLFSLDEAPKNEFNFSYEGTTYTLHGKRKFKVSEQNTPQNKPVVDEKDKLSISGSVGAENIALSSSSSSIQTTQLNLGLHLFKPKVIKNFVYGGNLYYSLPAMSEEKAVSSLNLENNFGVELFQSFYAFLTYRYFSATYTPSNIQLSHANIGGRIELRRDRLLIGAGYTGLTGNSKVINLEAFYFFRENLGCSIKYFNFTSPSALGGNIDYNSLGLGLSMRF